MKQDILIAGVGGQGILTIAMILGRAAIDAGLRVKQSEVHGMAQRGGAVQSHMRISTEPIHSDVIPFGKADVILAMEPMESLRYLAWLAPEGWLVVNEAPVINIPRYPDMDDICGEIRKIEHHLLFDAAKLAAAAGSARAVNTALLGAASPFVAFAPEVIEKAISDQFSRKGEKIVQANLDVFRAAREMVQKKQAG